MTPFLLFLSAALFLVLRKPRASQYNIQRRNMQRNTRNMQYPPIVIININDMTQISFAFNLSETNNNNIGTVLPATELCRPYYLNK